MSRVPAQTFEDLQVWQKAHSLALSIYELTAAFPRTETYSLGSQARRAAVSVPANIAEGFRKRSRQDKARYLNIAQGSLEESRYYPILARGLGYCDPISAFAVIADTSRLLNAYMKAILRDIAENS